MIIQRLTLVGFTLILILVVGCGGREDQGTPDASSQTSAAAEPEKTTEPEPSTCEATDAERAYLAAAKAAGAVDSDECGFIEIAQGQCKSYKDGIAQSGDTDPVDAFIENKATIDRLAIKHLCPELLPLLAKADTGFAEGNQIVGKDVKPGTYRTTFRATDCYWERTSGSGATLDNDFVKFAPKGVTVRIPATDGGFASNGCGNWIKIA